MRSSSMRYAYFCFIKAMTSTAMELAKTIIAIIIAYACTLSYGLIKSPFRIIKNKDI